MPAWAFCCFFNNAMVGFELEKTLFFRFHQRCRIRIRSAAFVASAASRSLRVPVSTSQHAMEFDGANRRGCPEC